MKKTILTLAFTFIASFSAFSLPGTKQYIPDISGEYVYYRDRSFKNESIVGFLFYNESTYAARFYSPADEKNSTPERDITIYVSVNPESKAGMEFTGEKIQGAVSEQDTEIINYLHDLFYEFTSRRQKENLDSCKKINSQQDFHQFGGNVNILFNPYVPIFNIEEIKEADGQSIFSMETAGHLVSSTDESFSVFKGIEGLPKDKKRIFKKTKLQEIATEFGSQKIILDTMWKQSMENLWLLEDFAILSMTTMSVPEEQKNHAMDSLLRRLCQSTDLSYSIAPQRKITINENKISVMNVFYQPESENVTRDFKIITQNKGNGTISLLTLTIFDSVYQKNRSYFTKILESYKVSH